MRGHIAMECEEVSLRRKEGVKRWTSTKEESPYTKEENMKTPSKEEEVVAPSKEEEVIAPTKEEEAITSKKEEEVMDPAKEEEEEVTEEIEECLPFTPEPGVDLKECLFKGSDPKTRSFQRGQRREEGRGMVVPEIEPSPTRRRKGSEYRGHQRANGRREC